MDGTICFGDYKWKNKPGDLIECNFFPYTSESLVILFPHLCHVDRTNKHIIIQYMENIFSSVAKACSIEIQLTWYPFAFVVIFLVYHNSVYKRTKNGF